MTKRSNTESRAADFYPTPNRAAVVPVIPYLRGIPEPRSDCYISNRTEGRSAMNLSLAEQDFIEI